MKSDQWQTGGEFNPAGSLIQVTITSIVNGTVNLHTHIFMFISNEKYK